jgi:hypothetical protein
MSMRFDSRDSSKGLVCRAWYCMDSYRCKKMSSSSMDSQNVFPFSFYLPRKYHIRLSILVEGKMPAANCKKDRWRLLSTNILLPSSRCKPLITNLPHTVTHKEGPTTVYVPESVVNFSDRKPLVWTFKTLFPNKIFYCTCDFFILSIWHST